MTRTEQIEALLRSLFDYLPGPKTAKLGDIAGEAPTEWKACQSCGGKGSFGKKQRRCDACKGRGQVMVDAYTGEPVGTKTQRVRVADPRRIDSELARLARDEALRRGRHLDDPFQWEADRRRYHQAGSYSALERALERLRDNLPDLYSLTMRVLVYATTPRTDQMAGPLGQAIDYLSKRMPPEIKVPKWVGAEPVKVERDWPRGGDQTKPSAQRVERNAKIIRLAQEGTDRADIAREVGVSAATVSRVLAAVDLAGTATAA